MSRRRTVVRTERGHGVRAGRTRSRNRATQAARNRALATNNRAKPVGGTGSAIWMASPVRGTPRSQSQANIEARFVGCPGRASFVLWRYALEVTNEEPTTFGAAMRAVMMLPATVSGAIPLGLALMDPWAGGWFAWGLPVLALGVLIVAWTVRDFYRIGRGTLAPWDPPRHLVVVGLFARCRNPMYVGVLTTIVGWAVSFRSPGVLGYGLLVGIAFHTRVLVHEEPWAARTFPEDWPAYRENVPRWLPRLCGLDEEANRDRLGLLSGDDRRERHGTQARKAWAEEHAVLPASDDLRLGRVDDGDQRYGLPVDGNVDGISTLR